MSLPEVVDSDRKRAVALTLVTSLFRRETSNIYFSVDAALKEVWMRIKGEITNLCRSAVHRYSPAAHTSGLSRQSKCNAMAI